MILTLSVENTNLVMGCFDGDVLRFTSRLAADRNKTGDEYAISFKSILDMHGIRREQITGSIVASVVPALIREIMEALRLTLGKEPLLVGPGVKTGLNILSDNPAALGSDLVVNAVAATNEYPAPLIVIDLDTATTLLAVNEKKAFVGSIIAPGVSISARALAESCDQLPQITIEPPRELIGRNTVDCMKSGVVFGIAAMLDGMVDRMERELGGDCRVVVTGPMAEVIVPHCRREMTMDPTLLLKGLRRIYEKNNRK